MTKPLIKIPNIHYDMHRTGQQSVMKQVLEALVLAGVATVSGDVGDEIMAKIEADKTGNTSK